ncbi:hypothetical protein Y032_0097g3049 [Ancylostoma ceylanicum]|uniref:Uncharacterized protein n=1 Tax=Ancylostoma ceylanicum TaxID=53326 RepID=A0A016TJZ4_9BILA|nr:hypothetical protein Y032_0097g3049 [Ancylostoma ceylanicum]
MANICFYGDPTDCENTGWHFYAKATESTRDLKDYMSSLPKQALITSNKNSCNNSKRHELVTGTCYRSH